MEKLKKLVDKEAVPSYIAPLFWLNGESEEVLREEIKQMNESEIGGFIVESRPHPDFLGKLWWDNLNVIIDEAKKRNMKVWIFDDCAYPSGYCAGKIRDSYPEYLKKYICEKHIDAVGPLKGSSFLIHAWLWEDEKIVRVIAAKRADKIDRIASDSFIDLTDRIVEGILYWDVPEGNWRVFILICTRNGGEERTRDYLNPLESGLLTTYVCVG